MKEIELNIPSAWNELTLKQLYMVSNAVSLNLDIPTMKLYLLCLLSGVKLYRKEGLIYFRKGKEKFKLTDWELYDLCGKIEWVLSTRPVDIVNPTPINNHLIDVKFSHFFFADGLICRYSIENKKKYLRKAMWILGYRVLRLSRLSRTKTNAILFWWQGVKGYLSELYPAVFPQTSDEVSQSPFFIMQNIFLMLNENKPQENEAISKADTHAVLMALQSKIEYYNKLKIK